MCAAGVDAQTGAGKINFDANYQAAYRDYYSGNFESAYRRAQIMIEEANRTGDQRYLAAAYTFASLYSDHTGHVDESLENLYKALNIYKELGDTVRIASTYRYIGDALGELRMYQNATDLFYRSIKIAGDCNNFYEESRGYNSLCKYTLRDLETESDSTFISKKLKNIIQKMEFFSNAILSDSIDYLHRQNIINCFMNLASAYILKSRIENNTVYADSAQKYVERIRKTMGFQGMTLMRSYILEAGVMIVKNNDRDALFRMKEIEKLTATLPLTNSDLGDLYNNLSMASQKLGNLSDAIFYKQKSIEYQSYTVNEYNVLTGFEFQAKLMSDNEISILQREKELVEYANNQRLLNVRLISFWVFIVLLVLLGALPVLYLFLRHNKTLTRKLNILYGKLEKHNRKLLEQQNELAAQNEMIQQQRDNVDRINKEIMSSITYAQRIQTAAYSRDEDIPSVFPSSFLLIRSDSLVSGSFHLTYQYAGVKLLAAATCSRNGVPGSFFAMLGVATLKEVLVHYHPEGMFSPADILTNTEFNLNQTLSNIKGTELKENIDISIVAFDTDNKKLIFSTANQSIYLFDGINLKGYFGSKLSLGYSINNVYNDQVLNIANGTMIYIINNGIYQQVGVNDELFNDQQISVMIKIIGNLPCAQQQNAINEFINEWLGDNNQVGDIAIIGVRNTFW